MMKTQKNACFILSTIALMAAGCAQDRNAETYNREKLGQELAKQQEVAGVYRGTLTSLKNNSFLGSMSLRLVPNTRVSNRNSDFQNTQVPVLTGEIIVDGSSKGALVIRDSSYDPDLKMLKTSVSVTLEAGQSVEVDVAGNFVGNRFVGVMSRFDNPEAGASFELVKDGALPDSSALKKGSSDGKGDAVTDDPNMPLTYKGSLQLQSGAEDAYLVVVRQARRSEDRVVDMLSSVRFVQVTLRIGDGTQIQFTNSQWDERLGTLSGKSQQLSSGNATELDLYCQETAAGGASAKGGLSCQVSSTLRGLIGTSQFTPYQPDSGSKGKSK